MEAAEIIARAVKLSESPKGPPEGVRRAVIAVLWAKGAHATVKQLARQPYDAAAQVAERKAMDAKVRALVGSMALAVGGRVVREGDERRAAIAETTEGKAALEKQVAKIQASNAGRAGGLAVQVGRTNAAAGWGEAVKAAEAAEAEASPSRWPLYLAAAAGALLLLRGRR